MSGIKVNNAVALVTGANRGIGKAITQTLLKQGAAKVYAAVRNLDSAQSLVDEYGERVVPVQLDLQQQDSIVAAAKEASDVQIVINNAGVLKNANPLADDAIENLNFETEVNVIGLIRMAQAFAPILKQNGGGAFVQLNSVASLRCFGDFATYSASKSAAFSITQGLQSTLAEQGTMVVSVHPGPIDTDMAAQAGLDTNEPPSVVGEAIVSALEAGEFLVFPDQTAKEIGKAYQSFAAAHILPADNEG